MPSKIMQLIDSITYIMRHFKAIRKNHSVIIFKIVCYRKYVSNFKFHAKNSSAGVKLCGFFKNGALVISF